LVRRYKVKNITDAGLKLNELGFVEKVLETKVYVNAEGQTIVLVESATPNSLDTVDIFEPMGLDNPILLNF